MTEPTNADRAERATAVIEYYGEQWDQGEDGESVVSDLLADLMHWADAEGVTFVSLVDRAIAHYEAEHAEEREEATEEAAGTVNMDAVCEILRGLQIPAYVEQTGGGCATIYAGKPYTDDEGDTRYPCLAGPGWFEGPGWTNGRGSTSEFCYGPDDDGDSRAVYLNTDDPAAIAAGIAEQVREHRQA